MLRFLGFEEKYYVKTFLLDAMKSALFLMCYLLYIENETHSLLMPLALEAAVISFWFGSHGPQCP